MINAFSCLSVYQDQYAFTRFFYYRNLHLVTLELHFILRYISGAWSDDQRGQMLGIYSVLLKNKNISAQNKCIRFSLLPVNYFVPKLKLCIVLLLKILGAKYT